MAKDKDAKFESVNHEPQEDHGFGRSTPLSPEEQERAAREQGERIADGRARQGHIVLRTPLRRAIFAAGLIGILVFAVIYFVIAH